MAGKKRKNCWEFKKCGRELGGINAYKLGVCPASTEICLDGVHSGENAGRACWVVAGTMCRGKVHGVFAEKIMDCGKCAFYIAVRKQEGDAIIPTIDILEMIEKSEHTGGCEEKREDED